MGEWIKIECSTPNKPEVVKMARILGKPRAHVFGALVSVWAWFDRNSVDGAVDGFLSTDVDELAGLKGFSSAMSQVSWLFFDDDKQRVEIPNFSRHNGESAKKRSLNTDRQRRWRNASVDAPVDARTPTRVDKSTGDIPPNPPGSPSQKPKTDAMNNRWWLNNDSILTEAKRLGLSTRGQTAEALKAEIRAKHDQLPKTRTHARGNGTTAPPTTAPALDPDQGFPTKPSKFQDLDSEEDNRPSGT